MLSPGISNSHGEVFISLVVGEILESFFDDGQGNSTGSISPGNRFPHSLVANTGLDVIHHERKCTGA